MKLTTTLFIILFLISQQVYSEDYYWVGGTGNWSELRHWATNSGGNTIHSAIPDHNDNVIFDTNSFSSTNQTVTVDLEVVFCNNLDFKDAGQFTFNGNGIMKISASAELNPEMNFLFKGSLIFDHDAGYYSFITYSKVLNTNIEINGSGLNWHTDMVETYGNILINGNNNIVTFENTLNILKNSDRGGSVLIEGTNNTINFNNTVCIISDINLKATESTYNFNASLSGGSLTLDGVNSNLNFNGDIQINSRFSLLTGNVATNGQQFECGTFSSTGSTARSIVFDNSPVFIGSKWDVVNEGLTADFSAITITFTGAAECNGGTEYVYKELVFVKSAKIAGNNCNYQKVTVQEDAVLSNSNSYGQIFLNGNGTVTNDNTFDFLKITEGKEYIFKKETAQTINSIEGNGQCSAPIFIHSDTKYIQANFTVNTSGIELYSLIFRDIKIEGNELTANESLELGSNNEGWIVNERQSSELYWIGGQGYWNDASHWAQTSGGTGGTCVPFPTDNVFFDSNSFSSIKDSVIVNAVNAFCKDINFAEANFPIFTADTKELLPQNRNLQIFGSLSLTVDMELNYNKNILFEAETKGNTITTNGNAMLSNLFFQGDGGEWTLTDSLTMPTNDIEHSYGDIITNSQSIVCNNFKSTTGRNERSLSLGNSEITINENWSVSADKLVFNAGTSLIRMTKSDANMSAGAGMTYHNVLFDNESNANISVLNSSSSIFNNVAFNGYGKIVDKNNEIEYLTFNKNGYIIEGNTFGTLELTPLYYYKFGEEKTQTISSLIAVGSCSEFVYLKSDGSENAIFNIKNESVDINYVQIKNIEATGGATYTAHQLLDGSNIDTKPNNNGWTIDGRMGSRNLYWVGQGDTDEWTNENNWALSSGGNGGNCIPSRLDNVYFDSQSFSSTAKNITINSLQPECKSMEWTNVPSSISLTGGTDNEQLSIFGNLKLAPDMQLNYKAPIYFVTSLDEAEINLAGNTLNSNVYFNSTDKAWLFTNDFKTLGEFNYLSGNINTNSHDMAFSKLKTGGTAHREWLLGSSHIEISGKGNAFTLIGKIAIPENNSTITFTNKEISVNIVPQKDMYFHNFIFDGDANVFLHHVFAKVQFDNLIYNNGKHLDLKNDCILKTLDEGLYIDKVLVVKNLASNWQTQLDVSKGYFETAIFNKGVTSLRGNVFGKAELHQSSYIYGENTLDTLILLPKEQTYTFESGKTQTINKLLKIRGYSCGKINVEASELNQPAIFHSNTAAVSGYYVRLNSIDATGDSKFYIGGDATSTMQNSNGWLPENAPGYIYGLPLDTIIVDNELLTISTDGLNGDAYTTFIWDDGSTKDKITVSEARNYHVTAQYPGCSFTDSINVYYAKTKNAPCKDSPSGSIEFISNQADKNIDIEWLQQNKTIGSAQLLNNVSAGVYTLNINDKDEDTKLYRIINLNADDYDLELTIFSKDAFCYSGTGATMTLGAIGGEAPYTFAQMGVEGELSTVTHGYEYNKIYTFTVTDNKGCTAYNQKEALAVESVQLVLLDVAAPDCRGRSNGSASFSVTAGTPNYTYFIDGQETPTEQLTELSAGQHIFKVNDDKQCEDYLTFKIPEAPLLSLSYETLQNPRCKNGEKGIIQLKAKGGHGDYIFSLNNTELSTDIAEQIEANKSYKIKVSDNKSCEEELPLSLKGIEPPHFVAETIKPLCYDSSDGKINILTQEATSNYSIFLDNTMVINSTATIDGLSAGDYELKIIDQNGCSSKEIVTIENAEPLLLEIVDIKDACTQCENGSFVHQITGGKQDYQLFLNDEKIKLEDNNSGLIADDYILKVIDKNNCEAEVSFIIKEYRIAIEMPNIFTPNNDGNNDLYHVIKNENYFPEHINNFEAVIFNRWGKKLFSWNSPESGWSGLTNEGNEASEGTYFYIVHYSDLSGNEQQLKGHFLLSR